MTAPPAPATEVETELATAMRMSVLRLARRLRLERSSNDLSLSQIAVLGTLARDGAMSPGELAAAENVKPPSMTRTVCSLEEAGLVTRRPHDTDGRQVVVELTEHARAVLADDRERRNQWLMEHLSTLSDADLATLRRAAPILQQLAGR